MPPPRDRLACHSPTDAAFAPGETETNFYSSFNPVLSAQAPLMIGHGSLHRLTRCLSLSCSVTHVGCDTGRVFPRLWAPPRLLHGREGFASLKLYENKDWGREETCDTVRVSRGARADRGWLVSRPWLSSALCGRCGKSRDMISFFIRSGPGQQPPTHAEPCL